MISELKCEKNKNEKRPLKTPMNNPSAASAGWRPASYYPDPASQALSAVREILDEAVGKVERLATAFAGAKRVRSGSATAISAVERHSQQPDHEMGEEDRRGQRVPQALELRQRQHPRPPGPPGHLRARRRRVTRTEYDGTITVLMRPVRRQAAQLAQRRRRAIPTARSGSPIRPPASPATTTATRRSRNCRPTSTGSTRRPGRRPWWPRASAARTGSASRPTRRSSTSWSRAASPTALIRVYDVIDDGTSSPTAACSSTPAGRHAGRLPLRRRRQSVVRLGHGRAELDGVMVFSPQGKPIGRIRLPERCANLCFGGPKRNRLFMAASHSIYALYVNTQGALGGRERSHRASSSWRTPASRSDSKPRMPPSQTPSEASAAIAMDNSSQS